MIKNLYYLMFLFSFSIYAAPGEPVGASTENGWDLYTFFEGMGSGGTPNYGLGEYNNPEPNGKYRITLISQGYDDNGNLIEVPRSIYGMTNVRFPALTLSDESFDSGTSIVRRRVSLDDWIFSGDSNITITLLQGAYSQGGTNSSEATLSVTNNSTQPYWRTVANWSYECGWQVMTNSTYRLRIFAFQQSAKEGRPVRTVKFIGTGLTSGHIITNTVNTMSSLYDLPDIFHPGEFVADMDLSGFSDNEIVEWDFVAYPWIGNSTSILDTRNDEWTQPTSMPATLQCINDPDDDYCRLMAIVGPTGSDTFGLVFDRSATNYASIDPTNYFLTFGGALTKLQSTNNLINGFNNPGGSIIYGKNGSTNWLGSTFTAGSTCTVFPIVTPYPGESLTITHRSGSSDPGDKIKFVGVGFNIAASQVPLNAIDHVWIDTPPLFASASTAPIQSCPDVWITHGDIGDFSPGLKASTPSQSTAFRLRGNDLNNGFNGEIHARFVMGNDRRSTNGGGSYRIVGDIASQATSQEMSIVYGNWFGGHSSSVSLVSIANVTNLKFGATWALNIFSKSDSTLSGPIASFGSSSTTQDTTNLCLINNVFDGERIADVFSSGVEASVKYRMGCALINNVMALGGWKNDLTVPTNNLRYGNWPVAYGTGSSGNVDYESKVNNATLSFKWDMMKNGYYPSQTNILNYPKYIDRKSAPTDNSGGGDLRVQSSSPLFNFPKRRVIFKYDLFGIPFSDSSPAGISALGDSKRYQFFSN